MPTVKGKLKHGIKIADVVHFDFEVREQTIEDLELSECEADSRGNVAINVAMLARCITKIGDQPGPFTPALIKRARRSDYTALVNALNEAEEGGNVESSGQAVI